MSKIILRIILGICILSILGFGALIARELYTDWQSQTFYDELSSRVVRRAHTHSHSNEDDADEEQPDNNELIEWVPYVDFETLDEIYPGIVGWIKLDGTPIDYPVMQYIDNDFFLSHLPDGTQHRSGSIFLDYRNSSDFSDKSILIYGHESRAGDMFGALKKFRNHDFFAENPIIHLHTPEDDYIITVFAGYIANAALDHPPMHFENNEEFLEYIDRIYDRAIFHNLDIEITEADRIVGLVTCTYDFNDARLIIVGIIK